MCSGMINMTTKGARKDRFCWFIGRVRKRRGWWWIYRQSKGRNQPSLQLGETTCRYIMIWGWWQFKVQKIVDWPVSFGTNHPILRSRVQQFYTTFMPWEKGRTKTLLLCCLVLWNHQPGNKASVFLPSRWWWWFFYYYLLLLCIFSTSEIRLITMCCPRIWIPRSRSSWPYVQGTPLFPSLALRTISTKSTRSMVTLW